MTNRETTDEPVAWSYELALTISAHAHDVWGKPQLSFTKPRVPEGAIRNLVPLYAPAPVRSCTPREVVTPSMRKCVERVYQGKSVVLVKNTMQGLCAGEWLPFTPWTYLRCVGAGLLVFTEPMRLEVTEKGRGLIDAA